MWDIATRRIAEYYGLGMDRINNPFEFPRLPPRAIHPLGMSKIGHIKDNIIQDNAHLLARLSDFHTFFQKQSAGLFDLAPIQYGPDHPLNPRISQVDALGTENELLKKENLTLKKDLEKLKQK